MLVAVRILMIILFFLLSVFIYFKDRKSNLNKSYSLVIFTGLLWAFTVLMADVDLDRVIFWSQLSVLGPIWIPPSFLLFSLIYPDKKYFVQIKKIVLLFLPSLFLTFFIFTKYNIIDVSIQEWGTDYKPGILYLFVLLLFVIYIGYSIYNLLVKAKRFKGLERLQILYVLMAIILAATCGFVFNFILPIFFSGQSSVYGPTVSMFAFFLFTTYAVLKYRLMDIRVIIRRSAVFTVLVIFITALYAILAYGLGRMFTEVFGVQSLILNGVVMAILVAIGFEPLKKMLSEATDSFLFKAEYKPQEVLAEFADRLSSTLDLESLTSFVVTKSADIMKSHFVSLFLLDENKKAYVKAAEAGKVKEEQSVIDSKLFGKVSGYFVGLGRERDIIVREEIKKINEQAANPILKVLIEQLDRYEVNLIVPMYLRDKLVGLMFLGDKKSGDVYSMEDLRVLEIVAGQSAVAMQNAQLFEEQKKFAVHLKHEVEKATKDLQLANVQLKKLDKAKSEFISIASHQLRTPLTVIKGYISMIEQGDFGKVPQPISNPLDKVYKSTMRIIGLVEDLLNISRIESGRMKYDFTSVNMLDLVTEVYDELSQTAKNKGLDFILEKPEKPLPSIIVDRDKIREVVMNLMDNAVKYTESGFIKIKLEKGDHYLTYSVTDSGRGLEADEIPLLFQKFSRAKGVQLVHTEGTGLGLYIAKQIVAKHGGEIGVTSPGKDKGATFFIKFKLENHKLEKLVGTVAKEE